MIVGTKKRLGGIEETKTLLQSSEDNNINILMLTHIEENVKAKTRLTEIIGALFDAAIEADRRYIDNILTDIKAAETDIKAVEVARIERDALMRVIRRAGLTEGFKKYEGMGE